jgi:N-acetylglucosamine kinase-like BadF-type ATPase
VTATAPRAATGAAGADRPRPAVLAIDGGNSKTDVALVGADGTLLALASGGGSCAQNIGVDGTMAILGDLVERVAALAGLDPAARPLAEHAAWGVAVVCGAGINCVGVAPDGRQARFPSLGTISGDWGGGGFLGKEVLWWAVRGEDGRGPRTALRRAAPAHFGLRTAAELTEAIHFGRIAEERLGELMPVLFRVAAAGDRVARRLVDRLADEVVIMATVALRRLGLLDDELDVVLGGGILTARDPALMRRIETRLAAKAPRARPRVTSVPPVVGAALLGLDRAGAGPDAERRLRASFDGGPAGPLTAGGG